MPVFALFVALMTFFSPSNDPAALDNLAQLPTEEIMTPSGMRLWTLSPRAECERAEIDKAISTPPYCQGLSARGEIPEAPEAALALARQVMINIQLGFGDTEYDARASRPDTFPLTSLNFSRQLGTLTNYTRMKSDRQNTLSYLDKRTTQQWIARDLAACLLGGNVAGRVQDRGTIGQIDVGDVLSIGEFSCIDPRFSRADTPASFWLLEVAKREYDQLELTASGKMQRDLASVALRASIPETTLHLDLGPNPALHYENARMSYCIGTRQPGSQAGETDCDQFAVLFENIHLIRTDLDQGLHLKGSGRFAIALDRKLASRNGKAPERYDITTDELASWPGNIMPHQGTVIIMGRHDARLILSFQPDGSMTMTRSLPGGSRQELPAAKAADVFSYAGWQQDVLNSKATP